MTRFTQAVTAAVLSAFTLATGASAAVLPPRDGKLDKRAARASALPAAKWTAPDGHTIRLQLSRRLGRGEASMSRAEGLAALLESFHHGPEMSQLKLRVVHPDEMAEICGGEGILGCYGGDELVVPDRSTSDVPLEEVLAHEYGHHLAAHRRNSLGDAIEWGPQAWASTEAVCWRGDAGRLFTGYWDNPGEGFAEAYSRLHYPNTAQPWEYSRLLEPNQAGLDSVLFDARHVLSAAPTRQVLHGSLSGSRRTQSFSLTLPYDSSLRLALAGPAGADYDIRLKTPGYYDEVTRARHANDRLDTAACFQDGAPRTVKIRVTRFRGSGPFRLTASYFDRYDAL